MQIFRTKQTNEHHRHNPTPAPEEKENKLIK